MFVVCVGGVCDFFWCYGFLVVGVDFCGFNFVGGFVGWFWFVDCVVVYVVCGFGVYYVFYFVYFVLCFVDYLWCCGFFWGF